MSALITTSNINRPQSIIINFGEKTLVLFPLPLIKEHGFSSLEQPGDALPSAVICSNLTADTTTKQTSDLDEFSLPQK